MPPEPETNRERAGSAAKVAMPQVSLPKGGGAIKGIGEKFSVNAANGTASLTVPIDASPGRSGFGPQMSLSYDSGGGNGAFGFGWSLGVPSITRKTDKGLPRYDDKNESDEFILSGAEDLVPVPAPDGQPSRPRKLHGVQYDVHLYRPRIEGLFSRIERWTERGSGISHWRTISRDNVGTLYGFTPDSRIVDPTDAARIFSYLICRTWDDRGNVTEYEYKAEDGARVVTTSAHESNRRMPQRVANRYLKFIRYGGATPWFPNWAETGKQTPLPASWHFELVFDYGDHRSAAPVPIADGVWPVRPDPFSSYRAGFEVRTYRRCERVLMFHHFAAEPGVGADCLVRSTDFRYSDEVLPTDARNPVYTFLQSVTQRGYRREGTGYVTASMPPLEFEYTEPRVRAEVETLDSRAVASLPNGVEGTQWQWVDLDGEGLSGVLGDFDGGWGYMRNVSPLTRTIQPDGTQVTTARLGSVAMVAEVPAGHETLRGIQFLDLAGDGRVDAVTFERPVAGFFERTTDERWESFRAFRSLPDIDWSDANLKFVDLTGDGHADVLLTEDDVFTTYPSLGEVGFDRATVARQPWDEADGPRLVLSDGTQTVFLADMSGDGLSDIVRVRNGDVCYWPNLGYGRFGRRVAMDAAPRFVDEERFDPRRVRFADIDGSGTTDLLYVGEGGVVVCFNRSGNSWAEPQRLAVFPSADPISAVQVTDLLGTGTSCLVWSSALPGFTGRSLRYVNLMVEKPHLLRRTWNNLGAETRLRYASSTYFYCEDREAGRSWITRLPYPVHVVEQVEVYDWIGRSRFATRYAYHHGYFDGDDREFRGFGMVEQWDAEEHRGDTAFPEAANWGDDTWVPPILTRRWFHTGAFVEAGVVSQQYGEEYWVEPGLRGEEFEPQREAMLLPDTVLPAALSARETREAYRSLKGLPLRTELFADDASANAGNPYRVTEQNYTIRCEQGLGVNRHAVFFTHARESIDYDYEREDRDPRITHAFTLEVDRFGTVTKAAAVSYGRKAADTALSLDDQITQGRTLVTYTETRPTNDIDTPDSRRAPQPADTRTFELTELSIPAERVRFTDADIISAFGSAAPLDYEDPPTEGVRQKRLIEHTRTYYRRDDLDGPLGIAILESLALPFESYRLAFTAESIAATHGGRVTDSLLRIEGGYVHTEGDGSWWAPSGRVFYSPNPSEAPADELSYARDHFFLPHRYQDAFHSTAVSTESFVEYDEYKLLVHETRDALGNRITAGERHTDPTQPPVARANDYRVLQPALVMDANRNRVAAAFDALGFVVGTAVMSKPEDTPQRGDRIDTTFKADLTQLEIDQFLADPKGPLAATLLRAATTRNVYDLAAFWRSQDAATAAPVVAATLARETHTSEPPPADGLRIHASFSYWDGFGREIQKKTEAEAGPVCERDDNDVIILDAAGQPQMTLDERSPRWVGSGWMVRNRKGKPVRQYEPFFTDTHRFEFDSRIGVSALLFYDALDRVVATLHPNHAWEKVVFGAWRRESWDLCDTVSIGDPGEDEHVGAFFSRLPRNDYIPTWFDVRVASAWTSRATLLWPDPSTRAAEQRSAVTTAVFGATPAISHLDSLGRPFLNVAHNKFKYSDSATTDPATEEFYRTRAVLDIEGNQRAVIDAHDRVVMRYAYDMLGNRIHTASIDAGERWLLNDASGKPLCHWTARDERVRTSYDALRRPTHSRLRQGNGAELLVARSEYGEARANPEATNARGRMIELYDQSGVVVNEVYDFKGNVLRSTRRLAAMVQGMPAYRTIVDWSGAVDLDVETYVTQTRYDALNRLTQLTAPHPASSESPVHVIQPVYNAAALTEQVHVWLARETEPSSELDPVTADLHAVTGLQYNARGQRTRIRYGNGVESEYSYDAFTFRLSRLLTYRDPDAFPDDCPEMPQEEWPGCHVQNLHYTHDPVGNIVAVRDDAQQTTYFLQKRVDPKADYLYDGVYRLIEATGREHLGQVGGSPRPFSYDDFPRIGLFHPNDGNAVGRYLERYLYDWVGNFLSVSHRGSDPANPGWVRSYTYSEPSLLESGKNNNRVTSTAVGGTTETYSVGGNGYDAHGNMLRMPHLQHMEWDFNDQLRSSQRQAVNAADDDGVLHSGERTFHVYDASGRRVRKVTELATGQIVRERIYLGGVEVYREPDRNSLVRESLHVMNDKQRVAIVEIHVSGGDADDGDPLVRYQIGNHLGSSSLELDDVADVISYEEYTPFGSTSYQGVRNAKETRKRYRFTGKERDEESGFYYHGARHYAPWIGRWTSPDPIRTKASVNLYTYVGNRPIAFEDPDGRQARAALVDDMMAAGRPISPAATFAMTAAPPSPTPTNFFSSIASVFVAIGQAVVSGLRAIGEGLVAAGRAIGKGLIIAGKAVVKAFNAAGEALGVAAKGLQRAAEWMRDWLPGLIAAPLAGVVDMLAGLVRMIGGAFRGKVSEIKGGLKDVALGALSIVGLKEAVAEKWDTGGPTTGINLPRTLAKDLSDARAMVPGDAFKNGMHSWHAASNAALANRLGPIAAPFVWLAGLVHESPLDWESFKAEQAQQGTVNHVLDSSMDIVANTFGIAIGLLLPRKVAAKVAASLGNYIPGPGDPDPAMGGAGTYTGEPSKAWGQYP